MAVAVWQLEFCHLSSGFSLDCHGVAGAQDYEKAKQKRGEGGKGMEGGEGRCGKTRQDHEKDP